MRVLKAVLKLYLYHIIMLVVLFAFMGMLWLVLDNFPVLFSWITTVVYCCMVYSVGWNYGKKDGRKIPGSFPQPSFPVKVSVFASILPTLLLCVRFLFPDVFPSSIPFINGEYDFLFTGNRLQGTLDLIFKIWYFPFGVLLGNGRFITYLIAILILPIMFSSGYFVGLTKFKLLDVLEEKLIFSNSDNKKK